jgi:hypothetical protein
MWRGWLGPNRCAPTNSPHGVIIALETRINAGELVLCFYLTWQELDV